LPLQSKVSVTDTSLSDRLARKPPVNEKLVPEPLLDSAEAAAIIKIHPKTLQRLARNGQIRGVQVGRLWRFRGSEIENWIQQKLAG
jgi:excisionase family DNA binding protein